jgi:hypothetical protein
VRKTKAAKSSFALAQWSHSTIECIRYHGTRNTGVDTARFKLVIVAMVNTASTKEAKPRPRASNTAMSVLCPPSGS